VALKLLRKSSGTPEQIAQLETEAAITASIIIRTVVRVSAGMDRGDFISRWNCRERALDSLIEWQGRVAEAQCSSGIQIASGLRGRKARADPSRREAGKTSLRRFAHGKNRGLRPGDLRGRRGEGARRNRGHAVTTLRREARSPNPRIFAADIYRSAARFSTPSRAPALRSGERLARRAEGHLKNQAVSLQAFGAACLEPDRVRDQPDLAKDPGTALQSYDELIEHLEYARTELQSNAAKPHQAKRVVMETDQDKQTVGWLVMALIGLMVVLGITHFSPGPAAFLPTRAAPCPSEAGEAARCNAASSFVLRVRRHGGLTR